MSLRDSTVARNYLSLLVPSVVMNRSSDTSLCDSTVARISITSRSYTGDDMGIGALLLHLHLLL